MEQLTADQISEIQEALRAEIRQKQELLKAYDLVRQHLGVNSQPQDAGTATPIVARTRASGSGMIIGKAYGENTRIVQNTIKEITGSFTIKDIHNALANTGLTIESVTTVFNRLRDKGIIRVVQKGKGRRPTIYARVTQ